MEFQREYSKYGRDMECFFHNIHYKLRDLPLCGITHFLEFSTENLTIKQKESWINIFKSELQYRRNDKINKIVNNIRNGRFGHTKKIS